VNKDLDDLKAEFVLAVYDQITKQIQQIDLKTSIVISWDSVIAVMLGRELGQMVSGHFINAFTIPLASLCVVFLALSGVFIFWTLKPRARLAKRPGFAGLLYTGDILRLGKGPEERREAYLKSLMAIDKADGIYDQFVNSVVLISDVLRRKNKSFMNALANAAISFGFLVVIIGTVAVRNGLLKTP
jgi:uncharacterized membrane protein